MIKRLYTSITLLVCSIISFAAPVSQEDAARLAVNFYFERSGGIMFTISDVQTISGGSLVVMYIFQGMPGQGFVIVSGDDRVYPVPGYSLTGQYNLDETAQPPAFRSLMQKYTAEILHHIDFSLPATAEAQAAWIHYGAPYAQFNPAYVQSVPPLLGPIAWGQGCYYNAYCPVDTSVGPNLCGRVPVGCVAISMVQLMKYWSHPPQGTGSNGYVHPVYGIQSANFSNTYYNWGSMPVTLTSASSAVAQVCYHAAVSVNMDFGPTGSGAGMVNARDAMTDHFGFDTIAAYLEKNNYTDSLWGSMIRAELDSAHPIIYKGTDSVIQVGHAWVIDGYQGVLDNHFHCNWGWNGSQNGWFYLDSLTTTNYHFSYLQGAIIGLIPSGIQAPVAAFSASPTIMSQGIPVSFTDNSSNFPTAWHWDFGDGQTSAQQHPQHIYGNPGVFDVSLAVSNMSGSDSITKYNYITVTGPLPVVQFSATPMITFPGDTIFFTDLSSNNPIDWKWDFGDGDSSQLQHPWHIYTASGIYTVSLKSYNTNGYGYLAKPQYIFIMPLQPLPYAWFTGTPSMVLAGQTVDFTDYSAGNPHQWEWHFPGGDPSISTLQHPQDIRYDIPGNYDVQLVVSNFSGHDTLYRHDYIVVGSPGMVENTTPTHRIFPVPARDVLNIVCDQRLISVSIMDLQGRQVLNQQWDNGSGETFVLDISQLSPGIYRLELQLPSGPFHQKILIVE